MDRYISGSRNCKNGEVSGSRNRKKGEISGSRNRQNGRQILYLTEEEQVREATKSARTK